MQSGFIAFKRVHGIKQGLALFQTGRFGLQIDGCPRQGRDAAVPKLMRVRVEGSKKAA